MRISSEIAKRLLLDLISKSHFPGEIIELAASLKAEIANAEIETIPDTDSPDA